MAPRETEDNAYAKFWGDKQRALWYVMVFLEWSIQIWQRQGLGGGARVNFCRVCAAGLSEPRPHYHGLFCGQ